MTVNPISWLKYGQSVPAQKCRYTIKALIRFEIPVVPVVFWLLGHCHAQVNNLIQFVLRVFYFTPMFKAKAKLNCKNLYLYSGMPLILGQLKIEVGDNVRMSGISTFSGRAATKTMPLLKIGSNVDIGWQNSISVGTTVVIGDNVRLAGKVFLAGYPGHPLNAEKRAAGLPDDDYQAKPITLEKDVWVGTGATILAGVIVGEGAIIAAGSVVTKSVEPFTLVAGNPAIFVKSLS